jgi:hypothetical protein
VCILRRIAPVDLPGRNPGHLGRVSAGTAYPAEIEARASAGGSVDSRRDPDPTTGGLDRCRDTEGRAAYAAHLRVLPGSSPGSLAYLCSVCQLGLSVASRFAPDAVFDQDCWRLGALADDSRTSPYRTSFTSHARSGGALGGVIGEQAPRSTSGGPRSTRPSAVAAEATESRGRLKGLRVLVRAGGRSGRPSARS